MAKYPFLSFVRAQRAPVPPALKADLSGQTVVVTGANTGLGFETAAHFAQMNPGKLVVACRSKDKGEAAVSQLKIQTGFDNIEARLIDLSKFESVVQFVGAFEAENDRLDILVCNAGVEMHHYEASPSGWESTLQVNHLSTALLALLLLPRLEKTAKQFGTHPRLVIVSSDVHFWTSIGRDVMACPKILNRLSDPDYCTPGVMADRYALSKLLNILYTRGLSSHLRGTSPVIVNNVTPGLCYSSLARNTPFPKSLFMWLMRFFLARTTEEGARQIVWAALAGETDDGNADLRERARGAYVSNCSIAEESDWVFSKDGQECERRIWDETISTLEEISPKVRAIVGEYLSSPASYSAL